MLPRQRQVEAARGDRDLDLLVEDVRLVNVYTREIYPADIGVYDGVIVYVGSPEADRPSAREHYHAGGKFAVPGLIDSHDHIESSMMTPAGFAAAVLPRGTTSIVTDPHEIGNVLGLRGVRYMLEATEGLPLRVFVQAPSCVPSVPGLETAGADFGAAEVAEMLAWERVTGLAEVMDYVGVVQQAERMQTVVEAALAKGMVVSGHCPGLVGKELAAYLVGGPLSDHEGREHDELLEKLRMGMVVEGRVSSFSGDMEIVGRIVRELDSLPPNLVLCTDDVYPDDLLHHGHMDEVVRQAIACGIPPVDAIRTATLNAAQRHRLYDLGALAPGKQADILLVEDLEHFTVDEVFAGGRLVASGGQLLAEFPAFSSEVEQENSIHLAHLPQAEDFVLKSASPSGRERLNVLSLHLDLSRGLETAEFPVRDGAVDIADHPDICLVSILERHGKNGNQSLALIKGMGLRRGAIATTVAHDCHNLLVVGRDPADMALAARTLAGCGGGICSIVDGQVAARVPLPVAGLMSPAPVEAMAGQVDRINAVLREQGVPFAQPLSGILSLALPVIPAYGLTDLGLVDVARQTVISNGT